MAKSCKGSGSKISRLCVPRALSLQNEYLARLGLEGDIIRTFWPLALSDPVIPFISALGFIRSRKSEQDHYLALSVSVWTPRVFLTSISIL